MDNLIVISGCSGGGKSTLLGALARRGFETVEEPGRRVVREELASGGSALPWVDAVAFARRITAMARADHEAARALTGPVYFDRGLVDAAVALDYVTGECALTDLTAHYRYAPRVFLAPPWPELFVCDAERRHDFAAAVAEHERLAAAYPALGYNLILLPKASVTERVSFILERVTPD